MILLCRKTSKAKLSLSKVDEDISADRDISKPDENEPQPDQQQNKDKFVKVTRKLMKLTVGLFFFSFLNFSPFCFVVNRKKSQ